ncbi:MAG: protein-disulfide reductase DsbD domain-containing protein, partial [Pseudomonadota bacterium]
MITTPRSLLFLALSLLVAAAAVAQDDRPKPPAEVFRYAVFDAGDAIEIDWSVDEGAYMYKSAFGFESGDAGIVFGEPELPEGKVYSDEFLGEQVIYRDNFFVRIPYEVIGPKPEAFDLTIKSRGCLDSGFCYVPTTWVEPVALRADASEGALGLGASGSGAGGGLDALGGGSSDFPPPDEVFFPDVFAIDGNTAEIAFRIIPGFYLYKDKITVKALSDSAQAGGLDLPKGKLKTDEFFGEQEVYYDEVFGRVAIARGTPEAMTLELEVGYQGCADGGLCYLPQTKVLSVQLPAATTVTELDANSAPARAVPVSEQGRLAQIITGSTIWVTASVFFLAGLGLAFTP